MPASSAPITPTVTPMFTPTTPSAQAETPFAVRERERISLLNTPFYETVRLIRTGYAGAASETLSWECVKNVAKLVSGVLTALVLTLFTAGIGGAFLLREFSLQSKEAGFRIAQTQIEGLKQSRGGRTELAQERDAVTAQATSAELRIKTLEETLKKAQAELNLSKERCSALETEKHALEDRINNAKEGTQSVALEEHQKKIAEMELKQNTLQAQAESRVEELEKTLNDFRAGLKLSEEDCNRLKTEKGGLKAFVEENYVTVEESCEEIQAAVHFEREKGVSEAIVPADWLASIHIFHSNYKKAFEKWKSNPEPGSFEEFSNQYKVSKKTFVDYANLIGLFTKEQCESMLKEERDKVIERITTKEDDGWEDASVIPEDPITPT